MKHLHASLLLALASAFAAGPLAAQTAAPAAPPAASLGRISFPTSGAAAAQPFFERGVLLLHSFEFDDAAAAFRQARTADPDFALAYWGEALTHTHPLWRYRNRDAGLAVLNALAPTAEARAAKAKTKRERGYLGAVEALYAAGDYASALRDYERAMARHVAAQPDDDEAATFYAVALLATNADTRVTAVDARAAAVAEAVFLRNPEHPGALHYMIHAYDNPVLAPLGLRAAERYGRVAGGAAHALHMTSHIFFALGRWPEAARANEASWAASAARVTARGLGIDEHGYHAGLWLAYGYLQEGRIADARRVVDELHGFAVASGSRRTTSHYALARAAFIVESETWDTLPPAVSSPALNPVVRIAELSAEALAAFRRRDRDRLAALQAEIARVASATTAAAEPHHGVATGQATTLSAGERAQLTIAGQQAAALALALDGKSAEAITTLQAAAAVEDAMPFEFGPPVPVKPTRELLGELLAVAGRREDATREFSAVLRRHPNRARSLAGLGGAGR